MFLIVSRIRSAARSIIGSPTCACSKSSRPGDAAVVEHELERVVRDEPRRGEPVLRNVVAQPPPEEHRDRDRPEDPPSRRRTAPPSAPEAREPGRRGVGRARRSRPPRPRRAGWRRSARAARGTRRAVGRARRRRPRPRGRRGRGSRSITSAYGSSQSPYACGHGEAVRLEQVVGRDLVGDAVRHHDPRLALAARVEREQPPVDLDVEVPRRAPPGAAGSTRDDRAAAPCARPSAASRALVVAPSRISRCLDSGYLDEEAP